MATEILPGGCALEMLYGSSTGCHSDIEPNSRLPADQSGFVQGIMQELVKGKAKWQLIQAASDGQ